MCEELSTRWLQPTPCDGKPGLTGEEGEEGTGCVAATNTERNKKINRNQHYVMITFMYFCNIICMYIKLKII